MSLGIDILERYAVCGNISRFSLLNAHHSSCKGTRNRGVEGA